MRTYLSRFLALFLALSLGFTPLEAHAFQQGAGLRTASQATLERFTQDALFARLVSNIRPGSLGHTLLTRFWLKPLQSYSPESTVSAAPEVKPVAVPPALVKVQTPTPVAPVQTVIKPAAKPVKPARIAKPSTKRPGPGTPRLNDLRARWSKIRLAVYESQRDATTALSQFQLELKPLKDAHENQKLWTSFIQDVERHGVVRGGVDGFYAVGIPRLPKPKQDVETAPVAGIGFVMAPQPTSPAFQSLMKDLKPALQRLRVLGTPLPSHTDMYRGEFYAILKRHQPQLTAADDVAAQAAIETALHQHEQRIESKKIPAGLAGKVVLPPSSPLAAKPAAAAASRPTSISQPKVPVRKLLANDESDPMNARESYLQTGSKLLAKSVPDFRVVEWQRDVLFWQSKTQELGISGNPEIRKITDDLFGRTLRDLSGNEVTLRDSARKLSGGSGVVRALSSMMMSFHLEAWAPLTLLSLVLTGDAELDKPFEASIGGMATGVVLLLAYLLRFKSAERLAQSVTTLLMKFPVPLGGILVVVPMLASAAFGAKGYEYRTLFILLSSYASIGTLIATLFWVSARAQRKAVQLAEDEAYLPLRTPIYPPRGSSTSRDSLNTPAPAAISAPAAGKIMKVTAEDFWPRFKVLMNRLVNEPVSKNTYITIRDFANRLIKEYELNERLSTADKTKAKNDLQEALDTFYHRAAPEVKKHIDDYKKSEGASAAEASATSLKPIETSPQFWIQFNAIKIQLSIDPSKWDRYFEYRDATRVVVQKFNQQKTLSADDETLALVKADAQLARFYDFAGPAAKSRIDEHLRHEKESATRKTAVEALPAATVAAPIAAAKPIVTATDFWPRFNIVMSRLDRERSQWRTYIAVKAAAHKLITDTQSVSKITPEDVTKARVILETGLAAFISGSSEANRAEIERYLISDARTQQTKTANSAARSSTLNSFAALPLLALMDLSQVHWNFGIMATVGIGIATGLVFFITYAVMRREEMMRPPRGKTPSFWAAFSAGAVVILSSLLVSSTVIQPAPPVATAPTAEIAMTESEHLPELQPATPETAPAAPAVTPDTKYEMLPEPSGFPPGKEIPEIALEVESAKEIVAAPTPVVVSETPAEAAPKVKPEPAVKAIEPVVKAPTPVAPSQAASTSVRAAYRGGRYRARNLDIYGARSIVVRIQNPKNRRLPHLLFTLTPGGNVQPSGGSPATGLTILIPARLKASPTISLEIFDENGSLPDGLTIDVTAVAPPVAAKSAPVSVWATISNFLFPTLTAQEAMLSPKEELQNQLNTLMRKYHETRIQFEPMLRTGKPVSDAKEYIQDSINAVVDHMVHMIQSDITALDHWKEPTLFWNAFERKLQSVNPDLHRNYLVHKKAVKLAARPTRVTPKMTPSTSRPASKRPTLGSEKGISRTESLLLISALSIGLLAGLTGLPSAFLGLYWTPYWTAFQQSQTAHFTMFIGSGAALVGYLGYHYPGNLISNRWNRFARRLVIFNMALGAALMLYSLYKVIHDARGSKNVPTTQPPLYTSLLVAA